MNRLKRWLLGDIRICIPRSYVLFVIILYVAVVLWMTSCTYEINVRIVQPDQLPVTVDSPSANDTRSM